LKESIPSEIQKNLTIEKLKSEAEENENKIYDLMSLWDKREESSFDKSAPTEIEIEKLQAEIKDIEEKTEFEVKNAV
jgi:hypothetical protein